LNAVGAHLPQPRQLFCVLDAFGCGAQAHGLGESDNCRNHRTVFGVYAESVDKALVDLQRLDRKRFR
jgi:hypothetical protein